MTMSDDSFADSDSRDVRLRTCRLLSVPSCPDLLGRSDSSIELTCFTAPLGSGDGGHALLGGCLGELRCREIAVLGGRRGQASLRRRGQGGESFVTPVLRKWTERVSLNLINCVARP